VGGEDLHELYLATTLICICVLLVSVYRVVSGAVRELEEAPYTVLAEHEGWEEREYPATTWVSTEGFDIFPHDGFTSQQVNCILMICVNRSGNKVIILIV